MGGRIRSTSNGQPVCRLVVISKKPISTTYPGLSGPNETDETFRKVPGESIAEKTPLS